MEVGDRGKMRIWKWLLDVVDLQVIRMPFGAKILTVQVQGKVPQLWALCDEKEKIKEERKIAIYGTGNPIPEENSGEYISTFQELDGKLVWHVFEIKSGGN